MKMNKISKKLVKPATPTPQNLKNYKISFLDGFHQLPKNICVFLFYEYIPDDSSQLEESLARILVDFYPLAGRFIKNDSLIDCSDQGAELVEAEAPGDVGLIDLIIKIDVDLLNDLLPEQHFRFDEAPDNPLLSIQITRISHGGAAVAISVSHRVFDASSLGTFVAAWSSEASMTVGRIIPRPSFHLPSLLPSKSREELAADLGGPRAPGSDSGGPDRSAHKFVLRRLLFSNKVLTGLKYRVPGKPVSGVRVVCAVIARALIRVDRFLHGGGRGSVVFQAVNMRERTIPPQSRDACGNFVIPAITRRIEGEADVGVDELVRLLGDSVRNAIAAHVEILSPDRDGRDIITNTVNNVIRNGYAPETNLIIVSDFTRFGFDEADFGWGKPVWSGVGPQQPLGNNVKLMRKGDGIEAMVMLKENEMCWFVEDEELIPVIVLRNDFMI